MCAGLTGFIMGCFVVFQRSWLRCEGVSSASLTFGNMTVKIAEPRWTLLIEDLDSSWRSSDQTYWICYYTRVPPIWTANFCFTDICISQMNNVKSNVQYSIHYKGVSTVLWLHYHSNKGELFLFLSRGTSAIRYWKSPRGSAFAGKWEFNSRTSGNIKL